jgi:hypothetical protein
MRARQNLAATGIATAALLLAAPIVAAPSPQARAERASAGPPNADRDFVLARWQTRTRWEVMAASTVHVRHGQTPFTGAPRATSGHHCGREHSAQPTAAEQTRLTYMASRRQQMDSELAVGGERARALLASETHDRWGAEKPHFRAVALHQHRPGS